MTERKKCYVQGAEKEFAVGVCELSSFWGKRSSEGVWGQFHAQVESPGGQLGIVALAPVMAAESRVELRRGHNVRTGASSG